jgi:hypothetical protein
MEYFACTGELLAQREIFQGEFHPVTDKSTGEQ